jgi:hypothetical protein
MMTRQGANKVVKEDSARDPKKAKVEQPKGAGAKGSEEGLGGIPQRAAAGTSASANIALEVLGDWGAAMKAQLDMDVVSKVTVSKVLTREIRKLTDDISLKHSQVGVFGGARGESGQQWEKTRSRQMNNWASSKSASSPRAVRVNSSF